MDFRRRGHCHCDSDIPPLLRCSHGCIPPNLPPFLTYLAKLEKTRNGLAHTFDVKLRRASERSRHCSCFQGAGPVSRSSDPSCRHLPEDGSLLLVTAGLADVSLRCSLRYLDFPLDALGPGHRCFTRNDCFCAKLCSKICE